ncbi:MAG TPA: hypothetical protein VN380_04935 [Thermoanaerobaculia bacterium]|jgi:hypothetical protein|nr:hypothetical protein [Thermoanaerobaculia bacterium]
MNKEWQKLGLIFEPATAGLDWLKTHAQNPIPEHLGEGLYKVYFAARDSDNRSRGGFFVFDINRPFDLSDYSRQPLIDLGPLGAFDDAGVMPSSLVDHRSDRYLYYTGWSRTVDVPFAFHIGLVISSDGGRTYERPTLAPALGRNPHDPYITGAPFVLFDEGTFKMWYISGTKWEKESFSSKAKHYYTVKYAESDDGLVWRTNANLCLPYDANEYAIARPVVRKLKDRYEMWFTFRGGANTYRLGFATSLDGREWTRDPTPIRIDVSPSGWDSEMICYGYPFEHDGQSYVLYNGNSYGSTGVGLAVVKE